MTIKLVRVIRGFLGHLPVHQSKEIDGPVPQAEAGNSTRSESPSLREPPAVPPSPPQADPPLSDDPGPVTGAASRELTDQRIVDAVVGLDFGTSCTKILIRTPRERAPVTAVDFGDAAHRRSTHLLPSHIWRDSEDRFRLTPGGGGTLIQDLKVALTHDEMRDDAETAAAAFLALSLRRSRRYFLERRGSSLEDVNLMWQINLGLPAANYANTSLCSRFLSVLGAAARLADGTDESVSATEIQDALDRGLDQVDGPDEHTHGGFLTHEHLGQMRLCIIPEVAAEAAGYARSHHMRNGLHLLVDVGASTVDVTGFLLYNPGGEGDRYGLLACDVSLHGAMRLHRSRINAVAQHRNHCPEICRLRQVDPVDPIPDPLDTQLGRKLSERESLALQETDADECASIRSLIASMLIHLKRARDPNSPVWQGYVPVILGGGGGALPFYRNAVDSTFRRMATIWPDLCGFEEIKLSFGSRDELDAKINEDDFARFAVAWGLSYEEVDIGEITRPEQIDDIRGREVTRPEPIGSEMV